MLVRERVKDADGDLGRLGFWNALHSTGTHRPMSLARCRLFLPLSLLPGQLRL
jgi:hypothetical protein